MRAVLLDDEPLVLRYLGGLCRQIPGLEVLAAFDNAPAALTYLASHPADLLLTDIEMPGLNGIDAVRLLRETMPDLGVIFITGYEEYALKAFQMDAVAYLTKPCTPEELRKAVKRAAMLTPPAQRVSVRTFGHFAVFLEGAPVRFANSKAQELLALLVDRRGGVVTMEQAADLLWEDRAYDDMVKRLYRKAVGYLNDVFEGTGFFLSDRGSCHIAPAAADCDYFKLLDHPAEEAAHYDGEYLLDYSWGETTNGKLTQLTEQYRTPVG